MPRYMSKEEKAKMQADLDKRKAASRQKLAKGASKAPNQVKAKGWQRMTDAEKAAYRKETGRDKTLKAAQAAGDKYRRDRAAKDKPAAPAAPKSGDKGYKPRGAAAMMNRTAQEKAADAAAAAAETSRRSQRRQDFSDKVQEQKAARAAARAAKSEKKPAKGRRSGTFLG